jgi:predicted ATPase/DNA-binding CsgD family transcriptional regulator
MEYSGDRSRLSIHLGPGRLLAAGPETSEATPIKMGVGRVNSRMESAGTDELEHVVGNVPVHLTGLMGREEALGELASLVWRSRLLSLCGSGGSGKTRLAAALAEAVRADFLTGVWWVDLSATRDPATVAQVVAAAVLPAELATDSLSAAIAGRFAESSLLVLDGCEQVIEASAELVSELLARTQSLRVIATSRQPLGVPGEQVWRVRGLPVDQRAAGDGSAVQLFFQRAQEAASSFDPDAPGVREAVARICRWTDGMPLAIELAAARVPALGVMQIAERLERDISFLRHSSRTAPERHRTLQDVLEWSHRMLEPNEQRLFRRLGVFAGSFSLAAAETVCSDDALPAGDVLDLLSLLVDRSLVEVVEDGGPTRYRLLSAARQYAATMLTDSGESGTTRERHADCFRQLADAAQTGLDGGDQVRWLEQLELDHDNFREALEWLLARSPEDAARLASLLWPFWYQRGYYAEARDWFELTLASGDQISAAARAGALLGACEVACLQCDYEHATDHIQTALALVDELGVQRAAATALQRLGSIARAQAHYDEALELHGRSLAIWEQLGDSRGIASSRNHLGFVDWLVGDCSSAESHCLAALAEFRRRGNLQESAGALVNLGASTLYRGELELAAQRLEEALSISRRLGFQEGIAWSLHELAIVGRRRRQPLRELALMLRDALMIHLQLGDRWRLASVLEEIAGTVIVRQDLARTAETIAYAQALREHLGAPIPPVEAADRDAAVARVEGRLRRAALASALSEGRGWDLDHAVEVAVQAIDQAVGAPIDGATEEATPILTPRELAVLERITKGQTNREIAAELYISASTAGVHVSNILRKLGARRRVDASGLAHALGLLALA